MAKLFIKGARQNNLKNISVCLEHGSITCVAGPSGAGKSSLVFDTIYSEAQRRYIETFSPYARQFLERLPQPKVEQILNLPAAISVGQANPVRNSRSTVGTLSEITYFTRMLYFRNARPYCDKCQRWAKSADWKDVWKTLQEHGQQGGKKAWLTARIHGAHAKELVEKGYFRAIDQGAEIDLLEEHGFFKEVMDGKKELYLVVDRFKPSALRQDRVKESVQQAFSIGMGTAYLFLDNGTVETFSRDILCGKCGRKFPAPEPFLFSFNSPQGACSECKGFGRTTAIDWDLVIPNDSLSIAEGAIKPLENWQEEKKALLTWCKAQGIDPRTPWRGLNSKQKEAILMGKDKWYGIKGIFDWLETKRYKVHVRILLSRYRTYLRCHACKGTRFKPTSLYYRLAGKTIAQFYALTAQEALEWCKKVPQSHGLDKASCSLLEEIERRLMLMNKAGLGYLSLDRQSRTLSGGELSRLCLSRAVSTKLSETLYCLDEPSSGLHPRDVTALLEILAGLKESGNTLVIVENDHQIKTSSDKVIELGPGSGTNGGHIIESRRDGDPGQRDHASENGQDSSISVHDTDAIKGLRDFLVIEGASANNLKTISCHIPLGHITCVCGVSGSGKSSLVEECLFRGISRLKGFSCPAPGSFGKILGWEHLSQIRMVDQEPVSRNPRACPGTYLKLLDPLRRLLSQTEEASLAGLKPGYFSMNVPGGRCEQCKGQGVEVVEMQFLPDLYLPCPSCKGKRYSQQAMEYRYLGKNIVEILSMTIDEALNFFHECRPFKVAARPASSLGLGYLQLGQPLNTLSLGESQRLKIARSLGTGRQRYCLFILDEPSRGLHPREVRRLMAQLRSLARSGHTVIVVEHDLQVIRSCDWIIELGPEGGDKGGEKIFEGSTRQFLEKASTPTASFIQKPPRPSANPPSRCRSSGHEKTSTPERSIEIRGARHHNLKDLDVTIPKNRLVVMTGVSGSGKSSLAFDLIHKEAQRRYLESLPSYMKQFVRLHERFDVDSITGLSPSVAIEQKLSQGGSMSTVATLTETAHYLRLLFANFSTPFCPRCGKEMNSGSFDQICQVFLEHTAKGEVMVISPRIKNRKGWHHPEIQKGFASGASMVRADGHFYKAGDKLTLSRYKEHSIDWVWGPVSRHSQTEKELILLLQKALKAGSGTITLIEEKGDEEVLSLRYFCRDCWLGVQEPDPLLFSFHTRIGRCPACLGKGVSDHGKRCEECKGTRLSQFARIWKIGGKSIDTIFSLEVGEAKAVLEGFRKGLLLTKHKKHMAEHLLAHVIDRLSMLSNLGLDYLPLDRAGKTLSGGESQRIRLAAQAGSNLTGLTIVLDEPTIGLHPSDNRRLVETLKGLRDRGNTVIVVEHDEETIRSADWIIDMGPGGGSLGGEIVAQGCISEILKEEKSRTALGLKREKRLRVNPTRLERVKNWLEIKGIKKFNLKDLDIKIPLGAMTVITGVSGSGKSTLLNHVIRKTFSDNEQLDWMVHGGEIISRLVTIDHSPIGRTPRSCPATYTGIWSEIRHLFSRTQASRIKGFDPGHFSYNTKGGRCEKCGGQGMICQRLSLLPDVYVTCEQCGGRRFTRQVLDIKWKGKDIADVLAMSVDEAALFFKAIPAISKKVEIMQRLGLGYLILGQPSPSLSGGEAQRLKLARELSTPTHEGNLYLLDEPTVGLHMDDVESLVNCLEKLSDSGSTVIVVEHNLDFMTRADWFIDLGPGGGKRGGRLVFQGTAQELLRHGNESRTADELCKFLGLHGS